MIPFVFEASFCEGEIFLLALFSCPVLQSITLRCNLSLCAVAVKQNWPSSKEIFQFRLDNINHVEYSLQLPEKLALHPASHLFVFHSANSKKIEIHNAGKQHTGEQPPSPCHGERDPLLEPLEMMFDTDEIADDDLFIV